MDDAERHEVEPDPSIPYDASDPKMVKAAKRRAERAREAELEVVKAVMGLPQGRKWVWSILSKARLFQSPFAANALVMAHNAGEMNIGLYILGQIMEACPDQYMVMAKEAQPQVKENGNGRSDD